MSVSRRYTIELDSDETPYRGLIREPGSSGEFEIGIIPRPSPVITPEKIYESFHKVFRVDYFCVSLKNKKRYIYIILRESRSKNGLFKYFWRYRIRSKIWKSTKFEGGEIIFERGERPTTPMKRRRVTPNEVVTPSTTHTMSPQIDPSDTILVGDKYYVRHMNAPGPLPIFHPVWGATGGMWRPMFWVGPTSSIEPTPRRGKEPKTTAELLNVQGNSCAICHSDVSLDTGKSNCDVDHLVPLHLGGSNSIKNLQILCVPCHRRKSALERRKVRTNVLVPTSIKMEPGSVYIARDDMTGSICEPIEFQERNPKEFLESGEDGIFKLIY